MVVEKENLMAVDVACGGVQNLSRCDFHGNRGFQDRCFDGIELAVASEIESWLRRGCWDRWL